MFVVVCSSLFVAWCVLFSVRSCWSILVVVNWLSFLVSCYLLLFVVCRVVVVCRLLLVVRCCCLLLFCLCVAFLLVVVVLLLVICVLFVVGCFFCVV